MDGADDEIEGVSVEPHDVFRVLPGVQLEAQLHANAHVDLPAVFFPDLPEGRNVPGEIQKEAVVHFSLFVGGVPVMVVGDADRLHAEGNCPVELVPDRRFAVAGETGM